LNFGILSFLYNFVSIFPIVRLLCSFWLLSYHLSQNPTSTYTFAHPNLKKYNSRDYFINSLGHVLFSVHKLPTRGATFSVEWIRHQFNTTKSPMYKVQLTHVSKHQQYRLISKIETELNYALIKAPVLSIERHGHGIAKFRSSLYQSGLYPLLLVFFLVYYHVPSFTPSKRVFYLHHKNKSSYVHAMISRTKIENITSLTFNFINITLYILVTIAAVTKSIGGNFADIVVSVYTA
jgi:hypothetical protein